MGLKPGVIKKNRELVSESSLDQPYPEIIS
jgi:hypothetical protein